jgi:hypothetical protein
MRFIWTAGIAVLVTCSGCGRMQESFQESFDKSFKESCRNGAVKKGADQKVADKFCDCALVKFKETKSMEQAAKTCASELKIGTNSDR